MVHPIYSVICKTNRPVSYSVKGILETDEPIEALQIQSRLLDFHVDSLYIIDIFVWLGHHLHLSSSVWDWVPHKFCQIPYIHQ